jgi:hypothetical protein
MISTTVLTIIAVSLALTIASQALSATRTESSRLDTSHARAAALEGLIGVEQNLAIDPFYLYAVVGSDEAARVCKLGDNRVVEPGELWPAECGADWDYVTALTASDVTVEINPPGPDDPHLNVEVTARRFAATHTVTAAN